MTNWANPQEKETYEDEGRDGGTKQNNIVEVTTGTTKYKHRWRIHVFIQQYIDNG